MSDGTGPESKAFPGDVPVTEVVSRLTDGVVAVDEEWRVTFLDEQAEALFERNAADLRGTDALDVFPATTETAVRGAFERATETGDPQTFEAFFPPSDAWFEVQVYPESAGLSVYLRDVTEGVAQTERTRERERTLQRVYEIIADADRSFPDQVDALLETVRTVLGTEFASLSRVTGDRYTFEAVAAPDGADVAAGDVVPLEITNCERVVHTDETLVLDDIERDAPDLAGRAGNVEWGISCYLGAPVFVDGEVYGTFCFYGQDARATEFSDWEVTLVDLLSNWVGNELERRRQVERLVALDELNGVVRAVTDAVVERSTRQELEAIVCRSLVATDAYEFAWIGTLDHPRDVLSVSARAGPDGYLAGTELEYDDDVAAGTPTGRAFRTGESQVVRDPAGTAAYGAWHDPAVLADVHTWAAIPLADEGTLYGVLNAYATRRGAVAEQERTVLEQLGGLVGHAIAAIERKQALTSDEVVELECRIRDVFETVGVPESKGTISFDRTVPVGDDEYLVYGWATAAGVETLRAVAAEFPGWETMDVVGEAADETRFCARLSEPPIMSVVAAQSGHIASARLADNTYRMRVRLPQSADVTALLDAVRETYPGAEVVAQRQNRPRDDARTRLYSAFHDDLTERQRTALESAFFAGFFEWPRESTGEDIADLLDIAPSTFHQHLRTGERKLLAALLLGDEGRDRTAPDDSSS